MRVFSRNSRRKFHFRAFPCLTPWLGYLRLEKFEAARIEKVAASSPRGATDFNNSRGDRGGRAVKRGREKANEEIRSRCGNIEEIKSCLAANPPSVLPSDSKGVAARETNGRIAYAFERVYLRGGTPLRSSRVCNVKKIRDV